MQTLSNVILQYKSKITKGMKKILLIMGIIIPFFAVHVNAEQTTHQVNVTHKIPTVGSSNTTVGTNLHRSQIMLPSVELVHDTDNNSINIMCSFECEAEVTVFDTTGNIVATSDINDTIFVPSSNNVSYSVIIEAESWYGTAIIAL